jgi:hypothetical protein
MAGGGRHRVDGAMSDTIADSYADRIHVGVGSTVPSRAVVVVDALGNP